MIYSRTARIQDLTELGVDRVMQHYAELPKNFIIGKSEPRYKFWDYALLQRIIKLENAQSVLDVSRFNDICFTSLMSEIVPVTITVHTNELLDLHIRPNKADIITCFGELEHIEDTKGFLYKFLKHVKKGGVVIITTDNENIDKHKLHSFNGDGLLELSVFIESRGFEFYNQEDEFNPVDYLDVKNGLHSLVMRWIGR